MNQCNNPAICSRRDTCDKRECQPGVELQEVLKIPNDDFSKGIFVVMDMPAQIYRYVDYIGKKDVKYSSKGFKKEQYTAMLEHYGAVNGKQSGKALSIEEGGALYPVYSEIETMLKNEHKDTDFLRHVKPITLSKKIRDHFKGEYPFAIPIYWRSGIVPLLIVFLKRKRNFISEIPEEKVKKLIKPKLKDIKIIVKDTRLESLGKLVSAIPDKPKDFRGMFSRWLLGWLEELDGLWLGNKIWFVVDHGLVHAKNLWKLANELADEKVANLGNKLKELNKMNPLIFSLAIWLHDIGYKGIHFPNWGLELMNTRLDSIIGSHGIISATLIINRKKAYNLGEFDDTILARSSLICSYHQKECPIIFDEYDPERTYKVQDKLERDSRFTINLINKSNADINGKDNYLILEKLRFNDGYQSKSLVVMASLLRLLDSCDFNKNRVGSESMIKLRKAVCNDNAKSLEEPFASLKKECLKIIIEKANKGDVETKATFKKIIQRLEKLIIYIPASMEAPNLEIFESLSWRFRGKKREKFKDTYHLGRFIGLLKQQNSYYDIHNSVKSVSFEKNDNYGAVDLVYEIDKEKDNIAAKIKKFITDKTATVYEKVLNKEQILKIKFVRLNSFIEEFDKCINKK